jgi:hypothetical protein
MMVKDLEVRRVGIGIRDEAGGFAASPDGLIGDDSGLEIKSMRADLLIDVLSRDKVPSAHIPQIQGNMLVFGRSSWWVVIYAPKMPLFYKLVLRDSAYCANLLKEISLFNAEKNVMVDGINKKRHSLSG